MNVAAMVGLYQRRGSVVGWQHASPIDAQYVDEFTQGPKASLGATLPATQGTTVGAFGETYGQRYNMRVYINSKFTNASLATWGMVDAGDLGLVAIVPFTPEPNVGVLPLPPSLLAAYNAGLFCVMGESDTLIAVDQFTVMGAIYRVKAKPRPIIDSNTLLAWRLLVSKVTQ